MPLLCAAGFRVMTAMSFVLLTRIEVPSSSIQPRMYRSLGNILRNPRVGLLFIRFDGKLFNNAGRLRINGSAEIDESAAAIASLPGAKRLVRVTAEHIFTNCPRYIPKYVPREGYRRPDPPWKSMRFVKDIFEEERRSRDS